MLRSGEAVLPWLMSAELCLKINFFSLWWARKSRKGNNDIQLDTFLFPLLFHLSTLTVYLLMVLPTIRVSIPFN